jgi:hypothetical protein
MASFTELKRRSVLPVAALALGAYYLLVFVPLAHRADKLDEPLQRAWQKLAVSLEQSNAATLDFAQITNQLNETRQELALLEEAKKKIAAHLDIAPALRSKMSAPFQLFDYDNERSKQIDDLDKQARQQQVAIDPTVFAGFPEHTADTREPVLLWAALARTDDLLETAIRCKVALIHSLEVAVALTNSVVPESSARWAEVALQLEFTAAADNAIRMIQSLPLRAEEILAAGLPPADAQKAPLFIDRLIIRKETPEKTDEVRVWVRAVGFILRD